MARHGMLHGIEERTCRELRSLLLLIRPDDEDCCGVPLLLVAANDGSSSSRAVRSACDPCRWADDDNPFDACGGNIS